MTNITDIKHARELKTHGLPVNMQVEEREYSRRGSILQLDAWKHRDKLYTMFVNALVNGNGELNEKESAQFWRTLKKLRNAAQRLDKYIGQLRRKGDLEAEAHSAFLVQKIIPLFEQIDEAIEAECDP